MQLWRELDPAKQQDSLSHLVTEILIANSIPERGKCEMGKHKLLSLDTHKYKTTFTSTTKIVLRISNCVPAVVDDAGVVGVMRCVSDGDSDFVNSQCPRELPKISSPSITLAAAVEESAAAITPIRCSLIFSLLRRWTGSRSSPIIMNPWSLKVRGLSLLLIEVRQESDHDDFAK